MVYFTCYHCGDSLKKSTVEGHYRTKCSRPKFVTCVDCMVDFHGEEFQLHRQCLTEEQKYSAKGSVTRQPKFKGEAKQLLWLHAIKRVYNTQKDGSKDQQLLLSKLVNHGNVPQKKARFQNFARHLGIKINDEAIESVWNLLSEEQSAGSLQSDVHESQNTSSSINASSTPTKGVIKSVAIIVGNGQSSKETTEKIKSVAINVVNKGQSSKETTENIKSVAIKVAKNGQSSKETTENIKSVAIVVAKNGQSSNETTENIKSVAIVVAKNRQSSKETTENIKSVAIIVANNGQSSKETTENIKSAIKVVNNGQSSKETTENVGISSGEQTGQENGGSEVDMNNRYERKDNHNANLKRLKMKFKWYKTIKDVLQASENQELEVKRLRKKVLKIFCTKGGEKNSASKERFLYKLDRHPRVKVRKNKAKLKKKKGSEKL